MSKKQITVAVKITVPEWVHPPDVVKYVREAVYIDGKCQAPEDWEFQLKRTDITAKRVR